MIDPTDVVLIHQLLGLYGHLIDARRWDDFAALFVEDATIDYRSSSGRIERSGRAEIVSWFRDAAHPAAHHVTNIVVDRTPRPDGSVEVWSKFFAPYSRPEHSPKRIYGGEYRDLVVCRDGEWKFSFKKCTPQWNVAIVSDEHAPDHRRTF